jgi:TonB dependent receptor/CarboxypepD_reg-like domain/TonB-dependent Receptor Plug Domain
MVVYGRKLPLLIKLLTALKTIKKYFLTYLAFSIVSLSAFSQSIIKGYIKNSQTGETLAGVSVKDSLTLKGTISNQYGFFSLKVKLPVTLVISSVGYEQRFLRFKQFLDSTYIIDIEQVQYNLNEVVIKQKKENYQNREAGYLSIPIERLNTIPTIFGEKDIFKALALTPGVSMGNEGTTGLYVRGGTPDQNLILLDEAPVYNTSHFFGILSVFNSEALKKVDLYKGFLPAHYGGRVSSVMDITMKDGNTKQRKKSYGIGLMSSNILWDGYLTKKNRKRGSFMVSGRGAYLGLVTLPLWLLYQAGKVDEFYTYVMYDVNAKLNYKIDDKSHIYASFYHSYDLYNVQIRESVDNKARFKVDWGNLTGTLRYNRIVRPNLFFKSVLLFTRYKYNIGFNSLQKVNSKFQTSDSYFLKPSLFDITTKNSLEYFPNTNHTIRMGLEVTKHFYKPTQVETSLQVSPQAIAASNVSYSGVEMGTFVEDEFEVSDFLKFNAGLRLGSFYIQGKNYWSPEPRLSSNINLPKDWTIKAAYSQGKQFIHLLTTNSIGLPNDVWVPATKDVPPQFARQYSLGVFKTFSKTNVTASIEGYCKSLTDQIDYRTGTSLAANLGKPWESLIEKNGIGVNYGAEFFLHKTEGNFSGWLAYTLAWNKQKFDNINNGNWYNSNFDRRHTLNLVSNYKFSPLFNVSSNWVFNTGRPVTVPIASYQPQYYHQLEFIYGNRNNFRLPSYHRLDIGLNWVHYSKKRSRVATWSVGAYNVYNRQNPYYVKIETFITSGTGANRGGYNNLNNSLYSFGVIPIIPYVSYAAKI